MWIRLFLYIIILLVIAQCSERDCLLFLLIIKGITDIEVPSLVDGKRRYLSRVSDFVSWDEACRGDIYMFYCEVS